MNTLVFSAAINLPKIPAWRKGDIRLHQIQKNGSGQCAESGHQLFPVLFDRRAYRQHLPSLRHLVLIVLFTLPLLTLPLISLSAQTLERVDPVSIAFAGSTAGRTGDSRLAGRNPAVIGKLEEKINIFASFAPSPLAIDNYNEGSVVGAASFGKNFSLGVSAATLTAGAYRETSGGIIGAANIDENLRLGIALTAQSISIETYGSRIVPIIDAGAQIRLAENFTLGASFVNATRTTVANQNIPQRLSMGLSFTPDSTFSISLDLNQELRHDLGFALGISFAPIDGLILRTGTASEPETFGYGVGYRIGSFIFDYGGAYVNPLGFRHVFGIGTAW